MSAHLKVADARAKSKDDLLKQLKESKQELSQLRVSKQSQSAASKVAKIRTLRKNVARILTVLSQKERENLKKLYATKNANRTPKNLRAKLTKSRRQALSRKEKSRKTTRAVKKEAKFPLRKFAVKI
jgi:large subunit ribosomal protein L35e